MKGKTKIAIQGNLDNKWRNNFEDMRISYEGNNTIQLGIQSNELK
jgi:hypothetical protein